MIEIITFALLIGALTFFLRIFGRVVHLGLPWRNSLARQGDFGDAMTHLLLADMIRSCARKIPRATPHFLLSGPQDYPAFFHWLVALIPRRTVESLEWFFSPTIEAVHVMLVFAASYTVLSYFDASANLSLAALITITWLLSPGLAIDIRRGAFLNERVFGFLFSNCYFMAITAWLVTGHPSGLGVAVLAGCVVSVSSKFGMQAMMFITPLSALLLRDVDLLVPLLLVLVFAPVMSCGYAFNVWRGSVRHTHFYARYLIHVGDYVSSFSTRQFLEAIRLMRQGSVRTAVFMVLNHPLVKTVTNNPAVWVALAVAYFIDIPYAATVLVSIVASAALVAILTSMDTFKYLGEGERYLEVALAPALLFIALAVPSEAASFFLGLIGYSVLRLAQKWRQLLVLRRSDPPSGAADTRALLEWLIGQPAMTIYSVPGRLAFPIAYTMSQHRFVWWFANAPERHRQADFEKLFEGGSRYPYPAPRMAYASWDGIRADVAILHRPTTSACKDAWGIEYDQVKGAPLFANSTYAVVGLNPDFVKQVEGHRNECGSCYDVG